MEILISAVIGGIIGGLFGLIIQFSVKDPQKRKKLAPLAVMPVVIAMPLLNQSGVPQKVLGLFSPTYRVQNYMAEKMKPLLEDPRVKPELEKGEQHAYAFAFILTQQGIKHLEDKDLDRWNEFRIKMSELHKPFCTGLMNGQVSDKIALEAFSVLPQETMNEFIDLMLKGAKRKLNNEGSPKTHVTFLQQGLKEIIDSLPETEKEKFAKILFDPKNANEEDACWATLKLLNGAKNVSQENRAKMFKMMAGV